MRAGLDRDARHRTEACILLSLPSRKLTFHAGRKLFVSLFARVLAPPVCRLSSRALRLNRFADRPSQRANYEAGESLPSPDCHDQTMSAPLPVAVHNRYCRETARRARDIPTPLVLACPGSRNIRLRLTNAGRVASR